MATRDEGAWRPLLLDRRSEHDREQLARLRSDGRVWEEHDTLAAQLRDLADARNPHLKPRSPEREAAIARTAIQIRGDLPAEDFGRYVFYPWSGRLVHLLPPAEFRELRLDRNRNKITAEEQARLLQLTIGVVGMSVGNAVALTLALEASCGHLKLADYDVLDLSNMNRIRAGVHEIGLPKVVIAARQIAEIDPYLRITLFPDGVRAGNIDSFLLEPARTDVLIDECDDLAVKLALREGARALRIPVIMETSDRGLLDVERFDLEPERPLFHGRIPHIDASRLAGLTNEEKIPIVLTILGMNELSTRARASLVEVGKTLKTWPQLASDVTLGAATVAHAVRRLALGEQLASGRRAFDIDANLAAPPRAPESGPMWTDDSQADGTRRS
jgi:molybdopterin/thiamine biosynthesis adenylyltransferase